MKYEKIRTEWDLFIENHKEYFKSDEELWNENLDKVKKYIKDNNKRPSTTDKNIMETISINQDVPQMYYQD